jgi:hypothetical protein
MYYLGDEVIYELTDHSCISYGFAIKLEVNTKVDVATPEYMLRQQEADLVTPSSCNSYIVNRVLVPGRRQLCRSGSNWSS